MSCKHKWPKELRLGESRCANCMKVAVTSDFPGVYCVTRVPPAADDGTRFQEHMNDEYLGEAPLVNKGLDLTKQEAIGSSLTKIVLDSLQKASKVIKKDA